MTHFNSTKVLAVSFSKEESTALELSGHSIVLIVRSPVCRTGSSCSMRRLTTIQRARKKGEKRSPLPAIRLGDAWLELRTTRWVRRRITKKITTVPPSSHSQCEQRSTDSLLQDRNDARQKRERQWAQSTPASRVGGVEAWAISGGGDILYTSVSRSCHGTSRTIRPHHLRPCKLNSPCCWHHCKCSDPLSDNDRASEPSQPPSDSRSCFPNSKFLLEKVEVRWLGSYDS